METTNYLITLEDGTNKYFANARQMYNYKYYHLSNGANKHKQLRETTYADEDKLTEFRAYMRERMRATRHAKKQAKTV